VILFLSYNSIIFIKPIKSFIKNFLHISKKFSYFLVVTPGTGFSQIIYPPFAIIQSQNKITRPVQTVTTAGAGLLKPLI
jgi:hypothetical protein